MKIYLVRDTDDNTVEAIYFSKTRAEDRARFLGKYFEVTEFETEDEPVKVDPYYAE